MENVTDTFHYLPKDSTFLTRGIINFFVTRVAEMKSAKRTDASAPMMSSNSAPGKGNAGIDGSTNLYGESNAGASNGKLTLDQYF